MQRYDFIRSLCCPFQDPKRLAIASADYLEKKYLSLSQDYAAILAGDTGAAPEYLLYKGVVVDGKEMAQAMLEYANDSFLDDPDQVINLRGFFNGKVATIRTDIDEIGNLFSSTLNSMFCLWQSYVSLTQPSPSEFFKGVVDKASNVSTFIYSKVLQVLNIARDDLLAAFDAINDLLGDDKLNNATSDDPSLVYKEYNEGYEGENPVLGLLGSLTDFKVGLNWSTVGNTIATVGKCIASTILGAVKAQIKIGVKIFRWIGSWFCKKFINPVDCYTDGDVYGSFDGSRPYKINTLPVHEPPYNETDSSFFSFGFGPIEFFYDYKENRVQSFIKPIDLQKAKQCLKANNLRADGSEIFDLSDGVFSTMPWEEALIPLMSLAKSDLSLNKDAGENQVYRGICDAVLFTKLLMWIICTCFCSLLLPGSLGVAFDAGFVYEEVLKQWLFSDFKAVDCKVVLSRDGRSLPNMSHPVWMSDEEVTDEQWLAADMNLSTAIGWFVSFVAFSHESNEWTIYNTDSGSLDALDVITNQDFMRVLNTDALEYEYNAWFDPIHNSADPNVEMTPLWNPKPGEDGWVTISVGNINSSSINGLAYYILTFARKVNNVISGDSTIVDAYLPFIGYSKSTYLSHSVNSHIKTDKENQQEVINTAVGVALAAGAIALSVKFGPSVLKWLRGGFQAKANLQRLQTQYSLNPTPANYKAYKKAYKLGNLRSKLLAVFSVSGVASAMFNDEAGTVDLSRDILHRIVL